MGSHAQLDAFAAELAEARMTDGRCFPTPSTSTAAPSTPSPIDWDYGHVVSLRLFLI
jgi:hypothetical protein